MYRGPFDFNGDGEMSRFERAAEFAFLHDVMETEESDDDDAEDDLHNDREW